MIKFLSYHNFKSTLLTRKIKLFITMYHHVEYKRILHKIIIKEQQLLKLQNNKERHQRRPRNKRVYSFKVTCMNFIIVHLKISKSYSAESCIIKYLS